MTLQSSTQTLQQRHMPNAEAASGLIRADRAQNVNENGPLPAQNGLLSAPALQKPLGDPIAPRPPCQPRREYSDIADEVESSAWSRKTVLSFDGGGVRGLSSLLILDRLMEEIAALEKENGFESSSDYPWMPKTEMEAATGVFLPCHYFDYIAGTSTGRLAAIMLGRLRMSVAEAIQKHLEFGNSVFGKPRWWHERSLVWAPRPKYSSSLARRAFIKIICDKLQQRNPDIGAAQAGIEPFRSRGGRTRTIVFAFSKDLKKGIEELYLWRTYDHEQGDTPHKSSYRPLNSSVAHSEPIWQVARATYAAPFYFESIQIGGRNFFDGGLGANNPALLTFFEIRNKHLHVPSVFVSIGTGTRLDKKKVKKRALAKEFFATDREDKTSRKRALGKYREIAMFLKGVATDVEMTNNHWNNVCRSNDTKQARFNVEKDLSLIPLNDWQPAESGEKTREDISRLTQDYLQEPDIDGEIKEMARRLVAIRQSRAETYRWESFATDIRYQCPHPGCVTAAARFYQKRNRLREHAINVHPELKLMDLEAFLDSGRLPSAARPKDDEARREISRGSS